MVINKSLPAHRRPQVFETSGLTDNHLFMSRLDALDDHPAVVAPVMLHNKHRLGAGLAVFDHDLVCRGLRAESQHDSG